MRKNILVLAPHTDDGELGCGGTVARFIEEGCNVHYATFSVCEESVPDGLPKDILEKEVKLATKELGIISQNLHIFRYPVRRFNEYRQDILENMVALNKKFAFDTVFMPSLHDVHQDHSVIANEGCRAFKTCTILCYDMPWNQVTFDSTAFFEIQQSHLDKKSEALKKYTSQQGIRIYMTREFIDALAIVRGVQINKQYAEAFEVIKWVN